MRFTSALFCASLLYGQISDTTPPVLAALDFTPRSVDVTAAPKTVNITARITDNLSGFSYAYFWFAGPSNQQTDYLSPSLVSGSVLDGTYALAHPIPQFVEPGVWKLRVQLTDLTGNTLALTPTQIAALGFPTDLTVVSNRDSQAPQIGTPTVTPSSVDVSSGARDVTVTVPITDNLSGVFRVWAYLFSPSNLAHAGTQAGGTEFSLSSGTRLNGVWQGLITIPQSSEAGDWRLSVVAQDAVRNTVNPNSSTNVIVTSLPADSIPPQLTAFSFTPAIIDTSISPRTVTFTVQMTDALSGADFSFDFFYGSPYVTLQSPSGLQYRYGYFNPVPVAGGSLNGTWQTTAYFPRYSETGTWRVSGGQLKDRVRNTTFLDTAALVARGFPTSLVVYEPSLTPDGSIGSAGGTVMDQTFGARAALTFPPGALPGNTAVAVDVLASSLGLPTPTGFASGSLFVNVNLNPSPPQPFAAPGLTLVLPLPSFTAPGTALQLFRLDPVTGNLVPAVSTSGGNVMGAVGASGREARFTGVSHLSTVAAFRPTAVQGDVNGDGVVNCADLAIVRAAFGKRTGQSGFDARADLNGNGVVDAQDLATVARRLPTGTVCP